MKSVLGILNMQEKNDLIRDLTAARAVEALPFAGRYRLLDFSLSSMVNSRITSVGVMLPDWSRSVLDHIRSGKDWDLARRRGGLAYLPASIDRSDSRVGDLKDLYFNLDYVEFGDKKYVLLANASFVYNIDFTNVLKFLQDNSGDIAIVYYTAKEDAAGKNVVLETSTNGIVTDIAEASSVKKDTKVAMGAYLMPVPTFAYIVRSTYERGGTDFLVDGIIRHAGEYKIMGYGHDGYVAHVDSTDAYYKANRDMLNPATWEELFMGQRTIYTRVKDEVPVQYKDTASVKNSLVANGCIIRGEVENSVIFRGVTVGKGAKVKDCILMQRADVQDGALLENVICDKNVIITKNKWLKGAKTYPYIVTKNIMI